MSDTNSSQEVYTSTAGCRLVMSNRLAQLTHGDDLIMTSGQSLINTSNLHDQMLPCQHTVVAGENLKLSEGSHTTYMIYLKIFKS